MGNLKEINRRINEVIKMDNNPCCVKKLYLSSNNSNESTKEPDELTEEDFYPPEDKRVWGSNVEDIPDGDNFVDYAKYFYGIYGVDIFDD